MGRIRVKAAKVKTAEVKSAPIKNMTEGNPVKLILGFAVPMLLGMLFQQFYSMVDSVIVGKCLGVDALAAVGSTGAINFMINGFVIGLCSGFAIPVAQRFGAGDYRDMRRFAANAGWLSVIFALVMTTAISRYTWDILVLMHTPENILLGAYNYIFYIFLGIPATFLYNLLAGIIRSLGDSRTPVVFLIISSILNVILDFFFIVFVGTGAEGAAYATVISQAVSGLLCFVYMRKKFVILKMERNELCLDKIHVKILCRMGIPMGLQYSITAIGSVVIQTSINGLGSAAVASVAAAQKVSMLFCCPFDALGGTMATYAGQNVGAKKLERVAQGVHSANGIGIIYALGAFVVTFFFGKQIPQLFVDAAEGEVIHQAYQYMVANALFFIALAFVNIYRFTIQGMGFSGFAVFAGVFEMVARALMGFAMVPVFGYPAVCFSSPLAWIFADIFLIPAFGHCIKRMQKQFGEEEKQAVLRAGTAH